MLTERRGFATAYLYFLCVFSLTLQPASQICTRGILRKVQNFINKAPLTLLDCKLYTPTPDDYENCPRATIECFADELRVLIEEWEIIKNITVYKLNMKLQELALEINKTSSECLQCERLEEKEAEMFLRGLKKTIMMLKSDRGDC